MKGTEQTLATPLHCGNGDTLVGDIGLIVLKGLLESGVGYIVTGWVEAMTPVDAAIADVHDTVLAKNGVLLRRLRPDPERLQALLGAPAMARPDQVEPTATRGAVIWGGRRGTSPAINRFAAMNVAGPVVGICFDLEILKSSTAVVLEPAPSGPDIIRAIGTAFACSHVIGRPVMVLIRSRAEAMRSTVPCRDNVPPHEAESLNGVLETTGTLDDAFQLIESTDALEGSIATITAETTVILCHSAVEEIIRAELSHTALADRDVVVVPRTAQRLSLAALEAIANSGDIRIIDERPVCRIHTTLLKGCGVEEAAISSHSVDLDAVVAADIHQIMGAWVVDADAADGAGSDNAGQGEEALSGISPVERPVPRRNATMVRGIQPTIAAALLVTQATLGVPTRIDERCATYQYSNGGFLTVTRVATLEEQGMEAIAFPGRCGAVLCVDGNPAQVSALAGVIGAIVRVVDGSRPAEIATAITSVCSNPIGMLTVIACQPLPIVVKYGGELGFDRDLVASDRVATALLPPTTVEIVQIEDPLVREPVTALTDTTAALPALNPAAEISHGWYRITPRGELTLRDRLVRTVLRSLFRVEV